MIIKVSMISSVLQCFNIRRHGISIPRATANFVNIVAIVSLAVYLICKNLLGAGILSSANPETMSTG